MGQLAFRREVYDQVGGYFKYVSLAEGDKG